MDWRIVRVDSVRSTNDEARTLAERGAPSGSVVVARRQTEGRGRADRSWQSEPGGLYLSALIRDPPGPPGLLPLGAGVAVVDALRVLGVAARVKWPNDVLSLSGRKLAGILVEGRSGPDGSFAVVGIGLNVANPVPSGATSLALESRTLPSLARVEKEVLLALRAVLDTLASTPAGIVRDWTAASATMGASVRAETGRGWMEGEAVGLDSDGALCVRRTDGEIERVTAGDVVHLQTANGPSAKGEKENEKR
jgi:BirA family transcriptional regulator, biotin operon repressor / biotin---[acetyl-CoA-carboxylase] ligase